MTFEVSTLYLTNFVLILTRIGATFYLAPVFGVQSVPARIKLGLALFVTLVLLPLQSESLVEVESGFPFFIAATREGLIGLAIGYSVSLVIRGVEMAAALVGIQLGFGLAEFYDPIHGVNSNTMMQFYTVLATLIFLGLNGHYLVIQGITDSFRLVPIGTFDPSTVDAERFAILVSGAIALSVRIAMPVLAAVLLADVGLAVASKAMPQLNVMSISFPIKIGGGLIVLMLSLPFAMRIASQSYANIPALVDFLLPRVAA